jgi:hypothetical protein
MFFISPLSLALSRKGREDVLIENRNSFQPGYTNKLSAYIRS